MERRSVLVSLLAAIAAALLPWGEARAQRRRMRRRVRRRMRLRRRMRRRIRRRVAFRTVGGQRKLVVPTTVAVGWELTVDNRLMEVKRVEPNRIVVQPITPAPPPTLAAAAPAPAPSAAPSAGPTAGFIVATPAPAGPEETLEIVREDTPENGANVEGSVIPEADTTTPGVDAEVEAEGEVEVEEDATE